MLGTVSRETLTSNLFSQYVLTMIHSHVAGDVGDLFRDPSLQKNGRSFPTPPLSEDGSDII